MFGKQKRELRAAIHHLMMISDDDDWLSRLKMHVDGWVAFLNAVDKTGLGQLRTYASALAERHHVTDPLSR